jgi:TP901 family phage tail tape measure protein
MAFSDLSGNKRYIINIISQYDAVGAKEAEASLTALDAKQKSMSTARGTPVSIMGAAGLAPVQDLTTTYGQLAAAQEVLGNTSVGVSKILGVTSQTIANQDGNLQKNVITWRATDGQIMKTNMTLQETDKGFNVLNNTIAQQPKTIQGWGDAMWNAAKRAMIVAPVWMLVRGAMQAALGTITMMIQGYIDLDEQMARIGTVIATSSGDIAGETEKVRTAILDMSLNSRVPLKQLAETFYFLRTSAMSSEEAMAAFGPTVALMEGTGVAGKEAARGVAGLYNTLKMTFDKSIPLSQQMADITDILSYTYTKQDVEMNELLESYSKLAPFISATSNSALELVTIMGVLNTVLMRSGRAGRLTGQTMIEIATKADKLADVFGIIIPKDVPLDFVRFLDQLASKLAMVGGKMSLADTQKLEGVFSRRGIQNIQLLTTNIDLLKVSLADAAKEYEGYTKKIQELKMNTVTGQLERQKNIWQAMGIAFITAATGTHSFAQALKKLNDLDESSVSKIEKLGWAVREYYKWTRRASADNWGIKNPELEFQTFEESKKAVLNQAKIEKQKAIEKDALEQKTQETIKEGTNQLKEQESVLKMISANEYAIALYKYQQSQAIDDQTVQEEALLGVVQARAKLTQEMNNQQLSFIKQYVTGTAEQKSEMKRIVELSKLSVSELVGQVGYGGPQEEFLIKNLQYLADARRFKFYLDG